MKKKVLLFIILFVKVLLAYAQYPAPVFKNFGTSDGLPSSQIYQVIQDKDGYLWFASDHGLAKYNGYEFTVFTSANGLSDNTVFKLSIDKKGTLWMQTFTGQLFYVEKNKIIAYKYNNKIIELVKNNIPKGFCVDSIGNIFFTCDGIGEYKIDLAGNFQKRFPSRIKADRNEIYIDEIDSHHYLTSGYINFQKEIPIHFYFKDKDYKNDSISKLMNYNGQISLTRKRDGKLLIILSKYIFDISGSELQLLDSFPNVITTIFEDNENKIWVSTYNGLYVCDTDFKNSKRILYLEKEFITNCTQDNEGGFWITTLNKGVYYLNSNKIKNYFFNDINTNEPICLTNNNKDIFAGFRDGTIKQLNINEIKSIWSFPENSFLSHIFYDSTSNKIYFSKVSPGYLYKNKFFALKGSEQMGFKGNYILRKNGEIVNATVNGIYKIRSDSIFATYRLSQRANCVYETKNLELLIGCNDGVFKLDEITGKTKLLHSAFKNVRVDAVKEMDSIICIATKGNGLGLLLQNKVQFINESNGICSNIIHHIAISGNKIWCASYNGISKIEILNVDPLKYKITNISIHEGLPNNEINDLIIYKDTVWVASKTAISLFNQHDDFSNKIPAIIHITSFIINTTDTIICNKSKLPYSSNNIKIGFEALSFKSNGSINYKYSLIHDCDTFTSNTKDRHVEFLSLKPGKYAFYVSSMNSSGVWSISSNKLEFTILEPYWQTWWFIIIISLIILLIVYIIFKSRINRIKKDEELKTDFNKQIMLLEIKALRAQMNPHFIFNVINSIQDYILKSDSKSAQRYLTKFAKLIRLILDNSFDGEVLLSEELKANKLYIELEQQRFEDKFDFNLEIDDEIDTDSLVIPSMIIQPFLENSIKHGLSHQDKKGKLTLSISKLESNLVIVIDDNGVGRIKSAEWNQGNQHEHISRGSFITSKRVEAYNKAHNTSIELTIIDLYDENSNALGTKIELKIPIKFKAMKF